MLIFVHYGGIFFCADAEIFFILFFVAKSFRFEMQEVLLFYEVTVG